MLSLFIYSHRNIVHLILERCDTEHPLEPSHELCQGVKGPIVRWFLSVVHFWNVRQSHTLQGLRVTHTIAKQTMRQQTQKVSLVSLCLSFFLQTIHTQAEPVFQIKLLFLSIGEKMYQF